MARSALTLIKTTDNSTAATATFGAKKIATGTGNGVYLHMSGTSRLHAENVVFLIERSSKSTGTGSVYVKAGSTAGANDYEPGSYSTGRDLVISVAATTGSSKNQRCFKLDDPSRFLDSRGYINMDFSTHFSTANGSSYQCSISAIYISR